MPPESLTVPILAGAQPEVPGQPLLVLQVDLNQPFRISTPAKRPLRPVVVVPAKCHVVPFREELKSRIDLPKRSLEPLPLFFGTVMAVRHGRCLANARVQPRAKRLGWNAR